MCRSSTWVQAGEATPAAERRRDDIATATLKLNRLRGALVQLVDALVALHGRASCIAISSRRT